MLKKVAKDLFNKLGFKLIRLTKHEFIDIDNGFAGVRHLMNAKNRSGVFFDVGANTGQTINTLQKYFPSGKIYAFDPNNTVYEALKRKYEGVKNVHLCKAGLGANEEEKEFFENKMSTMSSFLPLGKNGWGEVINSAKLNITTIDNFCKAENISFINLLKSDTQGFELEVLKGAKGLLEINKIQFIYLEINFVELYKGLPSFCDIQNFLVPYGFKLMHFYDLTYYENAIGWVDALYYNAAFSTEHTSSN